MPTAGDFIASSDLTLKGFVDDDIRITSVGPFTATTETVLQSMTVTAVAGVRYKITAVQSIQGLNANETAAMRLRWQTGATLTSGGNLIVAEIAPLYVVGIGFLCTIFGTFIPGAGQITVGATAVRNSGTTATLTSFGGANQNDYLLLEGV